MKICKFNFIRSIIIVVFFTLLFNSCTKNDKNTIKIGVILPLTGKLSVIGEGEKKGILLALDTLKNKYPNSKIEILIEDFASETKNAVTLANKLISVDNVQAIITSTTAAAEAVSPITDKHNIIHFVISPDIEILNKSKYNYRVYYNFNSEADILTSKLKNDNIKSISILAVQYSSYQKQIEEKIEPFLRQNNIELLSKDYFDISEKDFKTVISKIKTIKPNCIYLAPQVNQVELLSNQLMENQVLPNESFSMYASFTYNWVPTAFLNKLKGFNILTPKFQTFDSTNIYYNTFFNKYATIPNFDMMYAFDNLIILFETMLKSNYDKTQFEKTFNEIKNYNGASGKIKFIGNRDTDVEIVINNIK